MPEHLRPGAWPARISGGDAHMEENPLQQIAYVFGIREHHVAFPSRRDRPHGRMARSARPHQQLGHHGRGGVAVGVAFDAERPPRRADLRDAARPAAAVDRGQALSLLRRLPGARSPDRTLLLRAAVLAAARFRIELAADPRRKPARTAVPAVAPCRLRAAAAPELPLYVPDPAVCLGAEDLDAQPAAGRRQPSASSAR